MFGILTQRGEMTTFHQAVRDRFQEGGSVGGMLLALLGIAAFVLTVYALTTWQRQREHAVATRHMGPLRLFDQVARRLGLGSEEQGWLLEVARLSELSQPAALLIAEGLFDSAGAKADQVKPERALPAVRIAAIRKKIFDPKPSVPGRYHT